MFWIGIQISNDKVKDIAKQTINCTSLNLNMKNKKEFIVAIRLENFRPAELNSNLLIDQLVTQIDAVI